MAGFGLAGVAAADSQRPRPDRTPPTAPSAITVERATATSAAVTWRAGRDNVKVVGYRVFADGELVDSTPHTHALLRRLPCGSRLEVAVAAFDRARNVSRRSRRSVATTACPLPPVLPAPPPPAPAPPPPPPPPPPSSGGGGGGGGPSAANTPPVVTALSISAGAPTTNQLLTAVATAVDAEGGTVSLAYQWQRNGTPIAGATGATLDLAHAGNGDRGDAISVAVIPTDGALAGAALTSTAVIVVDSAPSILSVAISPPSPSTGQIVNADVTSSDPDGDAVSYTYRWLRNGTAIPGAVAATLDLFDPGNGDEGDTLTVTVTPSDGTVAGVAVTSAGATVTSPGPVLPAASVFVSTAGDDTNACTAVAPCASFQRAYTVADSGDVVEVAAGSYGDQPLHFDPAKTPPDDVVFRPAAGAAVTLEDVDFGADRHDPGASHVTIMDMTLTGDVSIPGCGVPDGTACPVDNAVSPGNDLTLRNLRVKGPYAFYCASCSNVSIIGGTWGPDTYACRPGLGSAHPEIQSATAQVKRPRGILVDGVTWQNFARCDTGDHTECLQVEPADDLTIRNSTFRNCDTMGVNIANDLANSNSAAGFRAPNNVLIENNVFDEARDSTGGPTFYALNIRECSNCTIRYNSWLQPPRMPDGETHYNVKFIGNVGPFNSDACLGGVVFSHNVWQGASCDPSDKNVPDLGFRNAALLDLRLLPTSPAIRAGDPSNAPLTDATGRIRDTSAPDAGAFAFS
jgi:hypothetical protein